MKEDLIKIVKENPNLDVVLLASTDDLTDESGHLLLAQIKVEITDIYNSPYDEYIYFDKDDVVEKLKEYLADNKEYADMSDEEYDKICEEKAKDYYYKKAIVIWASN